MCSANKRLVLSIVIAISLYAYTKLFLYINLTRQFSQYKPCICIDVNTGFVRTYMYMQAYLPLFVWCNPPINSKLQHTPRAYPGHLTVHRARGGGNLNVVLEGWGIWTRFISCSHVTCP